jgi:hypothetical protein
LSAKELIHFFLASVCFSLLNLLLQKVQATLWDDFTNFRIFALQLREHLSENFQVWIFKEYSNFADFSLPALFFGGSWQHFRQKTDVAAAPLAAGPSTAVTAAAAATAAGASSCRLRLPTGDWNLPGSRPVRQILGKQPSDKYITASTRLTVQCSEAKQILKNNPDEMYSFLSGKALLAISLFM